MTKAEWAMLQDLLQIEDGLSEWEVSFIENLHKNFAFINLSKPQLETLQKLHEKLC